MGLRGSKPTFDDSSNVVYFIQIPLRGLRVPNLSPFPLKLETYLRMAKIPHESIMISTLSSKGKTPWIRHRGKDVADSQFCIEYLNKQFGVNLNEHLTKEQQAVSRAILKMVEENLYWVLVCYRWFFCDPKDLGLAQSFPWLIYAFIRRRVRGFANGQGMGRHSPEEIFQIGKLDFKALSDYLGEKKFLFGDQPSETDCSAFGMLAQFVFSNIESPHCALIKKEFPNLERYCHTMRNTFWPDWDQVLKGDASSTKL